MHLGVQFFLLGVFKKLAIADRMALFADPVFAEPGAVRLLCGLAGRPRLRGADLLRLLRLHATWPSAAPTCSATSWRRTSTCRTWPPTSPSSGGAGTSRCPPGCATTSSSRSAAAGGGKWRTYRNLLITMMLGGLWHGASWTFVAWGLFHGVLLGLQRAVSWRWADAAALWPLRMAAIFVLICRLGLLSQSDVYRCRQHPDTYGLAQPGPGPLGVRRGPGAGRSGPGMARGRRGRGDRPDRPAASVVCRSRFWPAGWPAFLVLAMLLLPQTSKTFIYFQF